MSKKTRRRFSPSTPRQSAAGAGHGYRPRTSGRSSSYTPRSGNSWSSGILPAGADESDFSGPFIVGFGLRPSRRCPCETPQGRPRDIPVPEQKASAHARIYDDAGADRCLAIARQAVFTSAGRKASAPRSWFSPLNRWPTLSPVNASLRPSWVAANNSGSVRFATPSPKRTFNSYLLPVSRRTRSHMKHKNHKQFQQFVKSEQAVWERTLMSNWR